MCLPLRLPKKFMEDAGGVNSRGFGINSTNLVVGDTFFVGPNGTRSHAAISKAESRWTSGF